MGAYAFLRLLQRPAFVLIVPLAGLFLVLLLIMTLDRDIGPARRLNLSMLALPLVIGTIAGQTIHDVRSRLFSWSLPGLQRRLGASVVGLGLVLASLWTWGYYQLGGELLPPVGFSCFLFVFMLSSVLQRSAPLLWVSVLLAVSWAEAFFGLMLEHSVLAATVATLGASACAASWFSTSAWRQVLQSPHVQLIVNAFNSDETAHTAAAKLGRRSGSRRWTLAQVGNSARNWVRAAEHGSGGGVSYLRTAVTSYGPFLLVALMSVFPAFSDQAMVDGYVSAFHVLFGPPVQVENSIIVPTTLMQAAAAWGLVTQAPSMLQSGWVYPISRLQRTALVHRLSLRQCVRMIWALTVTFGALSAALVGMGAGTYGFSYLPSFFRGIIATAILIPLAQGFRFRIDQAAAGADSKQWSVVLLMIGTLLFGALATLVVVIWTGVMVEIAFPLQAALLLALAGATQALYYLFLAKHYRHADLI
ncbi:MAG: hypothetical protein ACI8QC_004062 [Planctomycetota bacterium]|jgi:hypothetical protein